MYTVIEWRGVRFGCCRCKVSPRSFFLRLDTLGFPEWSLFDGVDCGSGSDSGVGLVDVTSGLDVAGGWFGLPFSSSKGAFSASSSITTTSSSSNGSSSSFSLIPFGFDGVDGGSSFDKGGGGDGIMSGPGVGRIFLFLNLNLSESSIHLSMSIISPVSLSSSSIGSPSSFSSPAADFGTPSLSFSTSPYSILFNCFTAQFPISNSPYAYPFSAALFLLALSSLLSSFLFLSSLIPISYSIFLRVHRRNLSCADIKWNPVSLKLLSP